MLAKVLSPLKDRSLCVFFGDRFVGAEAGGESVL